MIIKTGRIEVGKTPSVVTGFVSTLIVDGEPVKKDEKPVDSEFKKLASLIDVTGKESDARS
jgi:hypothetical protein